MSLEFQSLNNNMENIKRLIELIEAVKNYPRLFIRTNKNDDDVSKDWSAVAQECKITTLEAQRLWDSLFSKYVDYLRGIQGFSLAHYMTFLQPYLFQINDLEYIDEVELLNAIDSNNTMYTKHNLGAGKILKNCVNLEKEIKTEHSDKHEGSPTAFIDDTEVEAVHKTNVMQQNSSFTNLSSLELIFLGYAKQLQKMPLALQLKTKRKIADIMDEAELQMIPTTHSAL